MTARIRCWTALGLVCLVSGCTTIRSTPGFEVVEGKEIRGSERFELAIRGIDSRPDGSRQQIRIQPDTIARTYDVEKWRKTWRDVERDRYLAVAGVHDNYDPGIDLIVDPFIAAVCAVFWLPSAVVALEDGGDMFKAFSAGVVSILPFMNMEKVRETVVLDAEQRLVAPTNKRETVTSDRIQGRRIDWELSRAGETVARNRVRWPEPLALDWCEWVLDQPAQTNFVLTLTSDELVVSGETRFRIGADLTDAVRRRWPDAADRPKLNVTPAIRLLDDKKRPVDRLRAGDPGYLEIEARNGLLGPTAYGLTTDLQTQGDVELAADPVAAIPFVSARDTRTILVPLRIHLQAPDGTCRVQATLADVFGRKTAPATLSFPVVHRDLPDVQVFTAVIEPNESGTHALVITLRNAGAGTAEEVRVSLTGLPPGLSATRRDAVLPSIDSMERAAVTLPVSLSTDQVELPIQLEITERLGLPPVRTTFNAAVVIQ